MELRYYLPLLLLFVLTITFIYVFFLYAPSANAISFPSTKYTTEITACKSGDSTSCIINSCSGTVRCVNGIWGGCIVSQSCIPGEETNCYTQACSVGHKTCNECGTGYSSCVFDKK